MTKDWAKIYSWNIYYFARSLSSQNVTHLPYEWRNVWINTMLLLHDAATLPLNCSIIPAQYTFALELKTILTFNVMQLYCIGWYKHIQWNQKRFLKNSFYQNKVWSIHMMSWHTETLLHSFPAALRKMLSLWPVTTSTTKSLFMMIYNTKKLTIQLLWKNCRMRVVLYWTLITRKEVRYTHYWFLPVYALIIII